MLVHRVGGEVAESPSCSLPSTVGLLRFLAVFSAMDDLMAPGATTTTCTRRGEFESEAYR